MNQKQIPSKPKGRIRAIWALLIILALAILVGGVIGFLYYSGFTEIFGYSIPKLKSEEGKETTPDLESLKEELEETELCPVTFTEEEMLIKEDFDFYDGDFFSLEYPNDWNVSQEDPYLILEGSSGANEIFELKSGDFETFNTSGYTKTSEIEKEVYCQEALQSQYLKGAPPTYNYLLTVSFERKGTTYMIVYKFDALGASIAGDFIDRFDIILKTIIFK